MYIYIYYLIVALHNWGFSQWIHHWNLSLQHRRQANCPPCAQLRPAYVSAASVSISSGWSCEGGSLQPPKRIVRIVGFHCDDWLLGPAAGRGRLDNTTELSSCLRDWITALKQSLLQLPPLKHGHNDLYCQEYKHSRPFSRPLHAWLHCRL